MHKQKTKVIIKFNYCASHVVISKIPHDVTRKMYDELLKYYILLR